MIYLDRTSWIQAHIALHVERQSLECRAGISTKPDVHEFSVEVVSGSPRVQADVGCQLEGVGGLKEVKEKIDNDRPWSWPSGLQARLLLH